MLKKIIELLTSVFEIFSAACLLFITGLVITQVVMRYVFNYPLTWSEELAIITFIYLGFMGIGCAYAERKHLYIDALLVMIPKSVVKVINCVVLSLSTLFLIILVGETIKTIIIISKMGMTTTALELPMFVIHLSVPVGCLFFLIQVVRRFDNLGEI